MFTNEVEMVITFLTFLSLVYLARWPFKTGKKSIDVTKKIDN